MEQIEIDKLYTIFVKTDIGGINAITKQNFFENTLKSKRDVLSDALCELVGISDSSELITFVEYLKVLLSVIFTLRSPY